MSKIITYTSITNQKDLPRTDITILSGYDKFVSPVMNSKVYKILAHKFLECDISIWVDGNIYLLRSPERLVKEWLGNNDIALFRHYKSKNLDWELKWIKYKFNRRSEVSLEAAQQVEHYKKLGEPSQAEMAMGGVIIRRHNPIVERFNEAWWAEICRWGQRDQLSLPMVLRQFPDLKINRIDGNIKVHPYLRYDDHKHYLT